MRCALTLLLFTVALSATGCATGSPLSRLTILPGQGVGMVRLLQRGERVQQHFGKPDRVRQHPRVRAIDYGRRLGVDFIVNKKENLIVQIHFNLGYRGRTPEGIGLGSSLAALLKASGGALKRVTTSRNGVHVHGSNRVLFRLTDPKPDEKYYFDDGCRGISYFIGPKDRVTQILVSQRTRSCACDWVQAALRGRPRQPAIIPGQGSQLLRASYTMAKIIRLLGPPDQRRSFTHHHWLNYRKSRHLDLTARKQTGRIAEIRFNLGYSGRLKNGIGLCSSLEEVLKRSGGALKTVRVPYRKRFAHGFNRVLYQIIPGKNIRPRYLFRDTCRGVLYWFDQDKRATQIVTHAAGRFCECLAGNTPASGPRPAPSYLRIAPGVGNTRVRVGDTLAKALRVLGKPERRIASSSTLWLVYWKRHQLDILAHKHSRKIIEVRFNHGYRGRLANGIGLCSSLKDALRLSGGALKTAQVPRRQFLRHGENRTLYKIVRHGNVSSYIFRDGCRGISYWFNSRKRVSQIVAYRPSRSCACHPGRASFTTTALTAVQKRQLALTPHRGNGVVRIGDTRAAIKRKLGVPDFEALSKTKTSLSYRYHHALRVQLHRHTGKTYAISFYAGYRGRLPNGVGLCTSLADLRKRLAPPAIRTVRAKEFSPKGPFVHRVLYHYTHPTRGITYMLRDTRTMVTYYLGEDKRINLIMLHR